MSDANDHDESNDHDQSGLDFDDPRIAQALRLGELRAKVDEVTGGEYAEHIVEATSMDQQEQFWEHILAYETAPEGTLLRQLRDVCDFQPPPLESLETGDAVHAALWQLIHALAQLSVYLHDTDHVSDHELYELLCRIILPERRILMPPGSGWNCHFNITEYPTPEYSEPYDAYLAYYADDDERQRWCDDFSDYVLPPKRTPGFNRDQSLPVPPE